MRLGWWQDDALMVGSQFLENQAGKILSASYHVVVDVVVVEASLVVAAAFARRAGDCGDDDAWVRNVRSKKRVWTGKAVRRERRK